ncbi:MAG: lipoate--protein ligase [Anaerolineaceae bacterium]|nr:lipoate--protein ligase [Anaerolineaceae bacterium]
MLFVSNQEATDPRINLAIEEYLADHLETDEDILLFYINEPSIIIGKNQNTLGEINQSYVEEHDIHVVRRLSGGGAVYHDLNNLNFSFITKKDDNILQNFKKFTAPVIRVLNGMGVPAELNGRNDIVVEGKKISGNAQYVLARKVVSHGTLLFKTDLDSVTHSLRPKQTKMESKGIQSVRSRVTNISNYLADEISVIDFRQLLKAGILGDAHNQEYVLNETDWVKINEISRERYQQWDWNYGRSPAFNIRCTQRFSFGEVDALIDVKKGAVESIKFYGDFLSNGELTAFENAFLSVPYTYEDLLKLLSDEDFNALFGSDLSAEEFARFLYDF